MGFTGTVARTDPADERCRRVALRVTFGLRTRSGSGAWWPRRRGYGMLAPVRHPIGTL